MDLAAESCAWLKLDDGLSLGEFNPQKKSRICNHKIIILKIDPKFYAFKLLSASGHGRKARTVSQWCNEFGLLGGRISRFNSGDAGICGKNH